MHMLLKEGLVRNFKFYEDACSLLIEWNWALYWNLRPEFVILSEMYLWAVLYVLEVMSFCQYFSQVISDIFQPNHCLPVKSSTYISGSSSFKSRNKKPNWSRHQPAWYLDVSFSHLLSAHLNCSLLTFIFISFHWLFYLRLVYALHIRRQGLRGRHTAFVTAFVAKTQQLTTDWQQQQQKGK